MLPFIKTTFVKSIGQLAQLPADEGIEIAFAGRSNAGKSSALNAVTGVKNLAKTSKTPGRTQTINLFQVTSHVHLVDLPGYGYARVSPQLKHEWDKLLNTYLTERDCLKGLILVMDIRHPLQTFDQHMLHWAQAGELPVHILLTKADKLSRGAAAQTLQKVMKTLPDDMTCTCQVFSSVTSEGVAQAQKQISAWSLKNV